MTNLQVTLHNIDCATLEVDTLIDAVITDPPYGIEQIEKWDKKPSALQSSVWAHLFTLVKPGGWFIVFSGHRTQHKTALALEEAGLEIKNMYYWLHAKTVLRNPSVATMLKAHRPEIVDADNYAGLYPHIKCPVEPIIVARKPIQLGLCDNILEYGTGAYNLSDAKLGERLPSSVLMTDIIEGLEEETLLFKLNQPTTKEREAGLTLDDGLFRRANPGRMWQPKQRKNTVVTVKPIELMEQLVLLHSREGQIVLDPFMGSGTTGCACVRNNRSFIGCDLDERAVDIALQRITFWSEASIS